MEILVGTSLIAAFVAGVAALFAPCCITVLLPSYLGNIFKEKYKIFFMTFIFFGSFDGFSANRIGGFFPGSTIQPIPQRNLYRWRDFPNGAWGNNAFGQEVCYPDLRSGRNKAARFLDLRFGNFLGYRDHLLRSSSWPA